MNENQKYKCKLIAEHYGKAKQRMQAVQELSELILVISRRADQKEDRQAYIKSLTDEIADSIIMIEQIRALYSIPDFDIRQRIDFKLDRQLERIANEQEESKWKRHSVQQFRSHALFTDCAERIIRMIYLQGISQKQLRKNAIRTISCLSIRFRCL